MRPVKTVTVGEAEAAAAREYPGSIRANQHADMGFEVAGRIILRLVNEGDLVKKGDELARLDDRDYQARLDQATASLQKAEADLNRSERIYEQNPGGRIPRPDRYRAKGCRGCGSGGCAWRRKPSRIPFCARPSTAS